MKKLTILFCLLLSGCKIDYFVIQRLWDKAQQVVEVKAELPTIIITKKSPDDDQSVFGRYYPIDKHIEIYASAIQEKMIYSVIGHELAHYALDLKGVPVKDHHKEMLKYLERIVSYLDNPEASETIMYWLKVQSSQEPNVDTDYIQCYVPAPKCRIVPC